MYEDAYMHEEAKRILNVFLEDTDKGFELWESKLEEVIENYSTLKKWHVGNVTCTVATYVCDEFGVDFFMSETEHKYPKIREYVFEENPYLFSFLFNPFIDAKNYRALDEVLELAAANTLFTEINGPEAFERLILDLFFSISKDIYLYRFEKCALFCVLFENLKSCSDEALSIAKMYSIDYMVAPEHTCDTLSMEEVNRYIFEYDNSDKFISERADVIKHLYNTVSGLFEKFTNPLIYPVDIEFFFLHMFTLYPDDAAIEWHTLAQVYSDFNIDDQNDFAFHELIFKKIPSNLFNNISDNNFIEIVLKDSALWQIEMQLKPEYFTEVIHRKLIKNLFDDEELEDYLAEIFTYRFDREKFKSFFKDYEEKENLHTGVYQPAFTTVIQFPALDNTVLDSIGLNITLEEFYYLFFKKFNNEDPSTTFAFDGEVDFDFDDDSDWDDEDFDFDDDLDDDEDFDAEDDEFDFNLDDDEDPWTENDFRHGNYNSIGQGDYWDSDGIHWDENDNILD